MYIMVTNVPIYASIPFFCQYLLVFFKSHQLLFYINTIELMLIGEKRLNPVAMTYHQSWEQEDTTYLRNQISELPILQALLCWLLTLPPFPTMLTKVFFVKYNNPLPHMPIFWSSNSAANKNMMSKIWTNQVTIIWLNKNTVGKRGNCSLRAISPFPTMFSKAV